MFSPSTVDRNDRADHPRTSADGPADRREIAPPGDWAIVGNED
ncbi:hypothetical protein [Amycolatopsis sp. NPDC059021]